MGLLVHSKVRIKVLGDKSLSKRDFLRVTNPLRKFGAKFQTNKGKLPIIISGTDYSKPISYFEKKGSAQCKSSIMLAALNTKGTTTIKARKSRDHTELLFKSLGLKIKVMKNNNYVSPYTNYYVANGVVMVPEVNPLLDAKAYKIIEQIYPSRDICPIKSFYQAIGGGGPGCITQQLPKGKNAKI